MQLVAYGMQDVYLTGNSQITFFKNLYRRHTNFSVEAVEQTFQSASKQFGNRLVAVISRNGDLLHRLWLEVEMPTDFPLDQTSSVDTYTGGANALLSTGATASFDSGTLGDTATSISTKKYRYVSKLGNTLLKSAEVEIGGQRIDKVYGRWEQLWQTYSKRQEKKECFDHMTANYGDNLYGLGANSAAADLPASSGPGTIPSETQTSLSLNLSVGGSLSVASLSVASSASVASLSVSSTLSVGGIVSTSGNMLDWDDSFLGTGDNGETPKAQYPILPERTSIVADNEKYKRTAGGKFKMYLPINFWFSKGSAGAALPLIALQYHEVRITLELAQASEILIKDCITPRSGAVSGFNRATFYEAPLEREISAYAGGEGFQMKSFPKLYSDFFYLDTDERRRFSQMSHEYLVEQLQFTGKESFVVKNNGETSSSIRLNFNHPTKAIYFTAEPSQLSSTSLEAGLLPNPYYNGHCHPVKVYNAQKQLRPNLETPFGPYDNSPFAEVGLMLNGHDRFSQRSGSYFSWVQPYQHHTRCSSTDLRYGSWYGMYSFCLSPEEHQPSGALNFSRIDNAQLKLVFKPGDKDFSLDHKNTSPFGSGTGADAHEHTRDVYVYALSYNVLRILSGMGGLAFSN
jgi:hypothetical protein